MKEEPLSITDIGKMVLEANTGLPRAVFMTWIYSGQWQVARLRLLENTELSGDYVLKPIECDWAVNPKADRANLIGNDFAVYDNYWMAYRHALLANKDKVRK